MKDVFARKMIRMNITLSRERLKDSISVRHNIEKLTFAEFYKEKMF